MACIGRARCCSFRLEKENPLTPSPPFTANLAQFLFQVTKPIMREKNLFSAAMSFVLPEKKPPNKQQHRKHAGK
jgi:hypothetical protein